MQTQQTVSRSYNMDETELPNPASPPDPPRMSTVLRLHSRKRSRRQYESSTESSDPALFSSDGVSPSADDYIGERRKHKWVGTWWGDRYQGVSSKEKRRFIRNHDSGIWMGSDSSDNSLEDELRQDMDAANEYECRTSESQPIWHPRNSTHKCNIKKEYGTPGLGGLSDSPTVTATKPKLFNLSEAQEQARDLVQSIVDSGAEIFDLA